MKKSIIISFVAGAVIFGSIGVLAGQYVATENAFPVQLNGENVQIEGYNIEGSTYFKLRDIAGIIGGFDVGFYSNTIQLAKDGYEYNNPVEAEHNVFVDEVYLDGEGCAVVQYDLDFDGVTDNIEMRQSRSYDNSEDGTLNCLKTELIIDGKDIVIDNAYKTHGCQRMFVADIDPEDNALDIVVFMSYKSTDAHLYKYENGEIIPEFCTVDYGSNISRNDYFPVGKWGTQPEGIVMRVNEPSDGEIGFYLDVPMDDAYFYKKTGNNEFTCMNVIG